MKKREIQLPDDNFTYGNPLRPSTPIKDVLGNFYGDVAEQTMVTRYDQIRLNTANYNRTRLKSADRHTRASALAKTFVNTRTHIDTVIDGSRALFKMKKF